MSDADGQMACWLVYFEQLLTVDPLSGHLQTTGLQMLDDDPTINKTAPSTDDVKEAVAKLRDGKAAGICNISTELLKTGGKAMIHGLYAI